jgi:hypothetical protein
MTCYLPYPFYLVLQAFSGTVPGACFGRSDSPQPDPFPPLPPPGGLSPPLVRLFLRYYGSVRLPTSVHRCRAPLRFTARPSLFGQTGDLPVPMQKASRRAQGLRPRGANTLLALTKRIVLPSMQVDAVGAPVLNLFSRLNAWPAFFPVNASPVPLRTPAHDSGPMWLAKPSSYGTFIHCFLPVSRRTNFEVLFPVKFFGTKSFPIRY